MLITDADITEMAKAECAPMPVEVSFTLGPPIDDAAAFFLNLNSGGVGVSHLIERGSRSWSRGDFIQCYIKPLVLNLKEALRERAGINSPPLTKDDIGTAFGPLTFVPAPIPLADQVRLLVIAHETPHPGIRDHALRLLDVAARAVTPAAGVGAQFYGGGEAR